ncbi:MAG TPA: NBR1-Ig-like domain-containing protein [Anaerolineales bacterium]|nr:NBR1-Ig-like domain-containing protein [Anaerolineales bacterium]
MFEKRAHVILVALVSIALLVTACASPAQVESAIATSVAQTVQAGATEIPPLPTETPDPALLAQPTLTQAITPTSEATLISAPSDADCIHAELVGEYPPDRTVFRPNTSFSKTWTIKNVGTCTWDSSYQLIFWSGELMGGSTYYNLPEVVLPGDDVSITIFLQSPGSEGFYTGYWRLKTPWNAVFGVGQYSQAFYAEIQVDIRPGQEYTVLSVTYDIVREPATGCPANVLYTVYATFTTNGPLDLKYRWDQKDGNESAVKELSFEQAGSQTVSREWMVGRGDSSNDRWMQISVLEPQYMEFEKAVFSNDCL